MQPNARTNHKQWVLRTAVEDKRNPEFPVNPSLQDICLPYHQSLQSKDHEFLLPRSRIWIPPNSVRVRTPPPISSPLCLLTRYYSRTFSNYSDMFPKKFSVYCILTTGLRVCVLTFLCFKKTHHFILISGWQKREDLSLKCFRDPMRNVFIFVCGPAVLSVVWHFNFLFLSYGGILISSHFYSFLHYRNLTGISISTICFLFTFINIETNN